MATDAAGIGTSAEVSAPGWEIRYFEDLANRLPPCAKCGGKMEIIGKPPKKPRIVCRNVGCSQRGTMIRPEKWEMTNV